MAINKLLRFYNKTSISPNEADPILKDKDSVKLKQSQKSPNFTRDPIFILKT